MRIPCRSSSCTSISQSACSTTAPVGLIAQPQRTDPQLHLDLSFFLACFWRPRRTTISVWVFHPTSHILLLLPDGTPHRDVVKATIHDPRDAAPLFHLSQRRLTVCKANCTSAGLLTKSGALLLNRRWYSTPRRSGMTPKTFNVRYPGTRLPC